MTLPTQDTVSLFVKHAMVARGERQLDVANALGLGISSISAKLRGLVKWSVDDIDALADHFGVTVVELVQVPAFLMPLQAAGGRSGGSTATVGYQRLSAVVLPFQRRPAAAGAVAA